MEETVIRVLRTLNKIRPFIQRDGGDVEFVKLEDGIVYVNLTGACAGCPSRPITLQDSVASLLLEEVPGIVDVRLAE